LYRARQLISANRVTPNSFAIASRGLVRVMRPQLERTLYQSLRLMRARVRASSLVTTNEKDEGDHHDGKGDQLDDDVIAGAREWDHRNDAQHPPGHS
jgi:hypothetical protein